MAKTFDPRGVLSLPLAYRVLMRMLGGNSRSRYLAQYVQPQRGMRILDVGCGPGDVVDYLPDVDYVGIDHEPKYIDAARRRFGQRGQFHCEDLTRTVLREPQSFDIVMANGVLHHLNDVEVRGLATMAAQALKPNGRFVTFDGCFVASQSRLARLLLRNDRGRFVRPPLGYENLVRRAFGNVEAHVRHDLLRVPYTICILVCTRPLAKWLESR